MWIAALLLTSPLAAQTPDSALLTRARAIHARVITVDSHVDLRAADFLPGRANFASGLSRKIDLPRMERGGLDAVFFSLFQDQRNDFTDAGYRRAHDVALAKAEAVRRLATELAPERIGLARGSADVRRLNAQGRKAALLGMENGYALGGSVEGLREFADLGVRYLSMAHTGPSQLADAFSGPARWKGLSPLGEAMVAQANRLGVLLDVSHLSREATFQVVRLSRAPVIASHSAMRALTSHPRNLDDEELDALAATGGVVQVVAYGAHLVRGRRRATVADLVDHIDYAVRRIGIDHVGIASDFDGGGGIVGWGDASETLNVTIELVRRGYGEEEITKLWGGNLLRAMDDADRFARDAALSGSAPPPASPAPPPAR